MKPEDASGGALPVYYTPKQVAEIFQVGARTIHGWIHAGEFPHAIEISGRWRIPRMDVLEYINRRYGYPTVEQEGQ